jgi:hypothetical protein
MNVDDYGEWLHQQAVAHGVTFFDGADLLRHQQHYYRRRHPQAGRGRKRHWPGREGYHPGLLPKHLLKYMITWALSMS